MSVIVLCGRLGTGKDTVADMVVEQEVPSLACSLAEPLKIFTHLLFRVDDRNFYGPSAARSIPFDRPIDRDWLHASAEWMTQSGEWRDRIGAMFNGRVTVDQAAEQLIRGLSPVLPITTPRVLLQYIGTEFGRTLWDEVWLYAVKRTVQAPTIDRYHHYVIRDGRFPNEPAYLKRELNAHVVWLEASKRVPVPEGPRHSSEPDREAFAHLIDRDLDNNGTLDELRGQVRTMLDQLRAS